VSRFQAPEKIRQLPGRRPAHHGQVVDRVFFGLGTLAAVWLAYALLAASIHSWWGIGLAVLFWLALAYVALPRLNRILTSIYVPDYFIGRTRTSDGLLGDPVNLAFIGTGEQLATAFEKAGWVRADPVDLRSSLRIVAAVLTRRSYPEAPVSPLLMFGRGQDAAYQQEVDGTPGQRHHLRVWKTPPGWLLPGGHRVDWLCNAAYDRRVGLSLFTLQITHTIDGDIDIERDYVIGSLERSASAISVVPLKDFTTGYFSRNGGGDRIHTDGTLPVVDVTGVPAAKDAPSLDPTAPRGVPPTVVGGAAIAVIAAVVALFDRHPAHTSGSFEATTWTGTALALLAAVLALATLRRSDLARQLVLAVSTGAVASRIWAYHLASGNDAHLAAIGHAAASIFVLVALSTPAARQWATGRPDLPEDS